MNIARLLCFNALNFRSFAKILRTAHAGASQAHSICGWKMMMQGFEAKGGGVAGT